MPRRDAVSAPLLPNLSREDAAALTARAERWRVKEGDRLLVEGERPTSIYLPLSGNFALHREGALRSVVSSPALPFGLAAVLDGGAVPDSVQAASGGQVLELTREALLDLLGGRPALRRALVDLMVASVREKQRSLTAVRRAFQGGITAPCAELREGPVEVEGVELYAFVFEEKPERLETALPPGVRLARDASAVVAFLTVPAPSGPFREALSLVPVVGPGGPALYVLEDHADSLFALLVGREKLGLPRQASRVGVAGTGVELASGARLLFRASWGTARPLSREQLARRVKAVAGGASGFELLARRRVPAPDGGAPQADELVSTPVTVSKLGHAATLQRATVAHHAPGLPGRRLLQAVRLTLHLRMEESRLLKSYLPEPPAAPLSLGQKALGLLKGLVHG